MSEPSCITFKASAVAQVTATPYQAGDATVVRYQMLVNLSREEYEAVMAGLLRDDG